MERSDQIPDKPNASVPLTEDDIKLLYDKGLLGKSTPEALLNTVWLNNTVHFGLRGCKEHRDMCWGQKKFLANQKRGIKMLLELVR